LAKDYKGYGSTANLTLNFGTYRLFWFQDETRIGQQGSITRIWAEKGTKPRAVRQQQFEYGYIFGAGSIRQKSLFNLLP
jgi:hypothetical protein